MFSQWECSDAGLLRFSNGCLCRRAATVGCNWGAALTEAGNFVRGRGNDQEKQKAVIVIIEADEGGAAD